MPQIDHPRVHVEFGGSNRCCTSIADARRPEAPLFALMAVRYMTIDGKHFGEAWPGGKTPEGAELFEHVSSRTARQGSRTILREQTRSRHFVVTKQFTLDRRRPWVNVRYTLKATGEP